MKAPICNFCLNSTILCASDQAKLDSGKITQLDVDISRALFKIEKKHRVLASSKMLAAKAVDDIVIVLIDSQVPIGLTEISSINKDVSGIVSKEVRVVERNTAISKMVQELLLPAKVSNVSSVWLPDGSSFIKVKLNGNASTGKIKEYVGKLNPIIKDVLGVEIFVEE